MIHEIKMARRLAQRLINREGTTFRINKDGAWKYYDIIEDNHLTLKSFLEKYPTAEIESRGAFYKVCEE